MFGVILSEPVPISLTRLLEAYCTEVAGVKFLTASKADFDGNFLDCCFIESATDKSALKIRIALIYVVAIFDVNDSKKLAGFVQ
jgi:hypothetical protein